MSTDNYDERGLEGPEGSGYHRADFGAEEAEERGARPAMRWQDLSSQQRAEVERRSWNRAIVLFIITLFSTFWVGSGMVATDGGQPAGLLSGWIFAVPLLGILLCHEFGHYIFARRHGVATSPPYFIPMPISFIGTMGAVISIRSPIHNRRQLLDIGASGPLAGFVPSVIVLVIGYSLSSVAPLSSLPPGQIIVLGDSLLTRLVQELVVGPVPQGWDVMIHPVGLAGWVGLFVTMLNLLPIWMLDGGHVSYAVLGRGQWRLAPLAMLGIVMLGIFVEPWWLEIIVFITLLLGVLKLLLGRSGGRGFSFRDLVTGRVFRHFPVPNEEPLGPLRTAVGWLCLGILILCFIPAPLRIMAVGG